MPAQAPFSSAHRVTNRTRGTELGGAIRVARSSLERTVGLLRTPKLEPGDGLWIERAPSIHMFFMRYPIDAVFVDRHRRVTKVVHDLKPWRAVWWARGARDCLELPAGTARATGTMVGDELALQPLEGTSQTSRAIPNP